MNSENKKCFICNKSYYNEKCDNASTAVEEGCCKGEEFAVRNQLMAFFLLRKLYGIPEERYRKVVEEYGNPSCWISLCHSCSSTVDETKNLFDQVTSLVRKIEFLRRQLQNIMLSSGEGQQTEQLNDKKEDPAQILRSFIIQGIRNLKDNVPHVDKCSSQNNNRNKNATSENETENIEQENVYDEDESDVDCRKEVNDLSVQESPRKKKKIVKKEVNDISAQESSPRKKKIVNKEVNEISVQELPRKTNKIVEKEVNDISVQEFRQKTKKIVKKGSATAKSEQNNIHKCKLCQKSFPNAIRLRLHQLSHPPLCPYCKEVNSVKKYFRWHVQTHEGEEIKFKDCSICGHLFLGYEDILKHKCRRVKKSHFCPKCGKGFYREKVFKAHLLNHKRKERIYSCSTCHKQFSNFKDAFIHRKIHPEKNIYSCSDCGREFLNKSKLKRHLFVHTHPEGFPCPTCDKVYRSEITLKDHEKIHQEENPFSCSLCPKKLACSSCLASHMKIHAGKRASFLCTICGKSLTTRNSLIIHEQVHNGQRPKPFACKLCNFRFSSKTTLKDHELSHSDEKPFSCSICPDIRFKRKSNLAIHMRKVHSEEPLPFSCSFCDKGFYDKSSTVRHERIHTGEKPFSCPICERSFSDNGALRRHTNFVHNEHPGFFPCTICNQTFHKRKELRHHESSHF